MGITGIGSDVARDVCWDLAPEARAAMSEEDKLANGCLCMGINAVKQDTCDFPGLGAYYNPEIDEAVPEPPGDEPVRPADIEIPPPPPEPEDQSDAVAVAEYLAALQVYQEEVQELQASAEADFAEYEAAIGVYRSEVVSYQEALIRHQAAVVSAVQPAESILGAFVRDLDWTFVDKENPGKYWPFLFKTWGAQMLMIVVLFFGILILQKRKDVK